MGAVNITLVTDPNAGFQGVYCNGKFLVDLGDNCNRVQDLNYDTLDFLLELLSEKFKFEYDSISGYQLSREIRGYEYTEYELYWPDYLTDVPIDRIWDNVNT